VRMSSPRAEAARETILEFFETLLRESQGGDVSVLLKRHNLFRTLCKEYTFMSNQHVEDMWRAFVAWDRVTNNRGHSALLSTIDDATRFSDFTSMEESVHTLESLCRDVNETIMNAVRAAYPGDAPALRVSLSWEFARTRFSQRPLFEETPTPHDARDLKTRIIVAKNYIGVAPLLRKVLVAGFDALVKDLLQRTKDPFVNAEMERLMGTNPSTGNLIAPRYTRETMSRAVSHAINKILCIMERAAIDDIAEVLKHDPTAPLSSQEETWLEQNRKVLTSMVIRQGAEFLREEKFPRTHTH
jgi:hypothetical protein